MATSPENMREGVRYYVSLVRDDTTGHAPLIVGTYKGRDERGWHTFFTVGLETVLIPPGNIVGASAARS